MPTVEEYLAQAKQHYQKGNYKQTIETYRATLTLDPACVNAAINLANIYLFYQQFTESLLVWPLLKPSSKIGELSSLVTKCIIKGWNECPDCFFQEIHPALNSKLLDCLDIKEMKNILFSRLDKIQQPQIKQDAAAVALLPDSLTGSIFYCPRTLKKPSINSGYLLRIAQLLNEDASQHRLNEFSLSIHSALMQQSNEWKNELKKKFPLLHYVLLNPVATSSPESSAIPISLPFTIPFRPPAYNPGRAGFFEASSMPAASAPMPSAFVRSIQPFSEIELLLNKAASLKLDLSDIKEKYLCPLSKQIMRDPSVAADGYTYDKAWIAERIRTGNISSPKTQEPFAHLYLSPSQDYRRGITHYLQKKISALAHAPMTHFVQASPIHHENRDNPEEDTQPGFPNERPRGITC
jgi:hypothetical protein